MRNLGELQAKARALQPITLPASRPFLVLGVLLILTLCESGGILMFRSSPVFAIFGMLFLLIPLVTTLIGLRPGATFVAADSEQVTRCLFFGKKTVRWPEVRDIRIGWVGHELVSISWNREILIHYYRDGKKRHVCDRAENVWDKCGRNDEPPHSLLPICAEHARSAESANRAAGITQSLSRRRVRPLREL